MGGPVRKRQARFRKVWESERGGQGGGQSGGNHDVGSAFDETRWCGAHAPPAHSPRGRHAASAIRKCRPLPERRRGFREGGSKVLSQVQVLLSPGRRPPPSKPRGAEGPSVAFQRNNFVWLRRIRRCLSPPRLRPRHPGHAPWSPSARCSGQKASDSAHLRQQDTDGLAEPKTSFQRRKDLDVTRLWVAGCFCC